MTASAMVIEGDFVPGVATVKAKPGVDYGEFAFPSIGGSPASVGKLRSAFGGTRTHVAPAAAVE